MRVAIVTGGADSLKQVQAYMPHNYEAREVRAATIVGRADIIVIVGSDDAGWTLDGYVIPRLASGLIWAEEVTEA